MSNLKPSLTELAAQVTENSKLIVDFLASKNLPPMSFTVDAPPSMPLEPEYMSVQPARMALIEASQTIIDLVTGPDDFMKFLPVLARQDMAALMVINDFRIAQAVPLEGDVSFSVIASKVGLEESQVRRVVRHLMTIRIFTEPRPGYVAHTAASAILVTRPVMEAWLGHQLEEGLNASAKLSAAFQKFGSSDAPADSAFGLAFNLPKTSNFFQFAIEDGSGENKGWRQRRFAEAMTAVQTAAHGVSHVGKGFDWESLKDGTVVDVGGSSGPCAVEIVKGRPLLKCIVQDLPGVEESFNKACPEELKSQISYQGYDFFTPQPVKDADVYFLRFILHDWPDSYCVKIVRNIVSAMKPTSRIVVMDSVCPPPGAVPRLVERNLTALDINMLTLGNSRERSADDWKKLFAEADERLEVKNFNQPVGSALTAIEVVLKESGEK